jgi:hypothetical protein
MYLNIRSLIFHFEELKLLVMDKNPKIVLLSETRVTNDIEECEIAINGYKILRCNSLSRHTGGVIMYLKDNIAYKVISNLGHTDHNYFLSIEVLKGFRKCVIALLYHSPSSNDGEFLVNVGEWCQELYDMNKDLMLIGDFNIDMSKKNSKTESLQRTIDMFGLKQVIQDFTRVEKDQKSKIDLVITNIGHVMDITVDESEKISDHSNIHINIICESETGKFKRTSWKKYSKSALLNKMNEKMNLNEFSICNLNEKAKMISENLKNCVHELTETIEFDEKKEKKYYNSDLRELKHERDMAYKRHDITGLDDDWLLYVQKRNNYSHQLRTVSNNFTENEILLSESNPTEMWNVLKKIIKNKNEKITAIEFDNEIITNEKTIARKFNDYFITSIETINENIETIDNYELELPLISNEMIFEQVDIQKIKNIIDNIETKSGVDNINKKVILDSFEIVGDLLVEVINTSLRTGEFPEEWKISTIVPVQKINNTTKCTEFRPINMLPIYEKVLECVVKEQLMNFIETNGILINEQSGFRKHHSCETALNLVLNNWKEHIEKKKVILAVFLDLKRAFETIDRNILLRKLESYGIRGLVLKWFESFLTNRLQRTKFGDSYSETSHINIGVPQGSVLAPILFILYMNDIVTKIAHCNVNLFADDTLVSIAGNDTDDITRKLNEDMVSLDKWLKYNKLKLNVDKTKAIIIGNRRGANVQIKIEDEQIVEVEVMKYLGVLIDNQLNFKKNTDFIVKKVAKKVGFLTRIHKKLTKAAKTTIYKTIISPHIDYCASILYLANEEDVKTLQVLQNRAMRVILRKGIRTPIRQMLKELGWLSIKQRIFYNTMILVYKIRNEMVPTYLTSKLQYRGEMNRYPLRNADHFWLPLYSKTTTQNQLFYRGLKDFNELPSEIKNSDNLKNFKIALTDFVKVK